jgi:site-specific DNA-methyltransferase (adenine-specific)
MGDSYYKQDKISKEFSDKCLSMIPERIAIRMIENEWIMRNKIVWYKCNAFPNPAKDRFSPDWENIYFFVKSKKYYFKQQYIDITNYEEILLSDNNIRNEEESIFRELRCVWDIPIESFSAKKLNIEDYGHHATFPKKLVEIPINATCPDNGIVLDIFGGTSTTAIVAKNMNRNFIMIELSKNSCNISRRRLEKESNLFDVNVFDKHLNKIEDDRNCNNCNRDCMLKDIGEVCSNWSNK